jgi:iron complex outermembrane receptor protein
MSCTATRLFLTAFLIGSLSFTAGAAEDAPEQPTETKTAGEQQPNPPASAQKVFRGSITVSDRPIVDGNEVDRYGSIVASVTEQQVEDLYAQDLSAALRRLPGVVISRYNLIGSFGGSDGGAIFIRGHGSGRPGGDIVTMTDGIPRFVGVWTHPLLDPLSMDAVDTIDVYRSAQPVLFGNMAFGAVDIKPQRRDEAGAGGRFLASYGTHNTVIGEIEYGGRGDRTDYYLTASHRSSDGHRMNADGSVNAVSGRLGLQLTSRWNVSVRVEHTEGDVNDPGIEGAAPSPIAENYATDTDFVLASVNHSHAGWNGHIKLYFDEIDADWRQWDDVVGEQFDVVTRSQNYGLRIQETVSPWSGGEIVLGLDHDIYGGTTYERRSGGRGPLTDLEFRNTAPYVMVSHVFDASVTVTPSVGVRFNDSRYFENQWGGQAGIKVGFGGQVVYANYARAFNLPGVYAAVLYGGWGRGDLWRELAAETLDHVEVGWLAALGRSVRLDISVFHDDVQDALRFVPPPPPPPQFANIGDYQVQGLEVSLRAEVGERCGFFLGATLSDSDPAEVPNLPRITAVGGVALSGDSGWRLNLDLQWVDEQYVLNPRFAVRQAVVDSYFLMNGKFALPLRWLGLGVDGDVFLAAENLADQDYEYRIGYPMPGRTVNMGLDLSF